MALIQVTKTYQVTSKEALQVVTGEILIEDLELRGWTTIRLGVLTSSGNAFVIPGGLD